MRLRLCVFFCLLCAFYVFVLVASVYVYVLCLGDCLCLVSDSCRRLVLARRLLLLRISSVVRVALGLALTLGFALGLAHLFLRVIVRLGRAFVLARGRGLAARALRNACRRRLTHSVLLAECSGQPCAQGRAWPGRKRISGRLAIEALLKLTGLRALRQNTIV